MKHKNNFTFKMFDELKVGDVFKFEPVLDSDMHSRFFTVYFKNDHTIKINTTYGKLFRFEYKIESIFNRSVIYFPNR